MLCQETASHEIDGVRKEKERLTAASIIDIFQAAHEPLVTKEINHHVEGL